MSKNQDTTVKNLISKAQCKLIIRTKDSLKGKPLNHSSNNTSGPDIQKVIFICNTFFYHNVTLCIFIISDTLMPAILWNRSKCIISISNVFLSNIKNVCSYLGHFHNYGSVDHGNTPHNFLVIFF